MKFLVDQNRSPRLATLLRHQGHDAGDVVVVADERIRVRLLPLLHDD